MAWVKNWGESGKTFLTEKLYGKYWFTILLRAISECFPKEKYPWIIYVPIESNLISLGHGGLKGYHSSPLVIIGLEVLQIATILSSQTGSSLGWEMSLLKFSEKKTNLLMISFINCWGSLKPSVEDKGTPQPFLWELKLFIGGFQMDWV